jgi:hypothetical protein
MAFHLESNLTLPLEREHEAWVIRCIEDYAQAVGLQLRVCSVSPKDEKSWPADEALTFRSKFFGLQFKRAYPLRDSVRCDIDRKSHQYRLICKAPEIFYALPTFTNRALRRAALDHCVFWRPCDACCAAAATLHEWAVPEECICLDGMRWGDFVEGLYRCELVQPNPPGTKLGAVARKILAVFHDSDDRDQGDPGTGAARSDGDSWDSLHLVAIEVPDES